MIEKEYVIREIKKGNVAKHHPIYCLQISSW